MQGIRYVVDEVGKKTAVVIDLKKHGDIWEDLYDSITAAQRRNEPRESLAQVKQRLQRIGKLKRNE